MSAFRSTPTGHITSPEVRATLRKMKLWAAAGSDRSVWEAITRPFSSTVVNTDEIFFSSFAFMTIGIWGSAADVVVNPFTQAGLGQVDIVVNLFCSVAIRLAQAFGVASITVSRRQPSPRQEMPPPEFPPPPVPAQGPPPSPGPENVSAQDEMQTRSNSGSKPATLRRAKSNFFS